MKRTQAALGMVECAVWVLQGRSRSLSQGSCEQGCKAGHA